jgi:S-adenosyl methyltransferase
MTERPSWAPESIDLDRPNAARVYDYLLGGAANFEKDREFGENLLRIAPESATAARLNRAFLRRAVKYCLDNGIRQFLDIGSGIPTAGNVHEIAQRNEPSARVLYVDREPVAVTHTELMLKGNENAAVIQGNLIEPEPILASPEAARLLNFDEPIAVLMVAVLHFLPDDTEPQRAVARYVDAITPGSHLVLSHVALREEQAAEAWEMYKKSTTPALPRTRAQLAEFFAGTDLVEPGIVWAPEWRPDPDDDTNEPFRSHIICGVARKP